MSARFTREERVRRRSEFERIYEHGARVRGRFMTVFVLENTLPVSRLGIAATRKLGDAVRRNRAKRLVRDVFRRNKRGAGYDIVVVPRAELLDADTASLETDFRNAVRRGVRR